MIVRRGWEGGLCEVLVVRMREDVRGSEATMQKGRIEEYKEEALFEGGLYTRMDFGL